jgi:hypothetical protein
MGVLRKILKNTVIQKYFFFEILINIKAARVNLGARKVYHGRRVGQAWYTLYIYCGLNARINSDLINAGPILKL